jgi:hypothetical protein
MARQRGGMLLQEVYACEVCGTQRVINRLKKRKMGHNKHMLCPTCCTIKAIFIKIE